MKKKRPAFCRIYEMCNDSPENVAKCFSLASQKAEDPSKTDAACVESFTASAGALSRDFFAPESRKSLVEGSDRPFIPYNHLPEKQTLFKKKKTRHVR